MSRTYRKRKYSFNDSHSYLIRCIELERDCMGWSALRSYTSEELKKEKERLERYRYKYKTDSYWRESLPRWFRNQVNRARRTKDRREVWKAVNWNDYEEQCDLWNCTSNDHWSYW